MVFSVYAKKLQRGALRGAGVAGLVSMLAIQGCASADPYYYRLMPWPGQAQSIAGVRVVEVRTPTIAPYLDRDRIVSRSLNYKLEMAENSAWSEPLANMIASVMAEDLRQRLPGVRVFAQGEATASDSPDVVVELNVTRFSQGENASAELVADVSAHKPGSKVVGNRHVTLSARPDGTDSTYLVASLSQLLGQLSDTTVDLLRLSGRGY